MQKYKVLAGIFFAVLLAVHVAPASALYDDDSTEGGSTAQDNRHYHVVSR